MNVLMNFGVQVGVMWPVIEDHFLLPDHGKTSLKKVALYHTSSIIQLLTGNSWWSDHYNLAAKSDRKASEAIK